METGREVIRTCSLEDQQSEAWGHRDLVSVTLLALVTAPAVAAIGTPVGFGSATVGGGSAATVTPTTNDQLVSYLSDSTQRVIVLTKIFDFTSYYGTATGKICKPWSCSNGKAPQFAIDQNSWCENYQSGSPTGTATYNKAGTSYQYSLKVGSKKTLLGKGSSAGLKGIGLLIQNVDNVIIQNIQISDINPQYVWGGDAITIVGSTHVWIDHNNFARVGRQFISTGYDPATGVTISNNIFDGRTSWSATCNDEHYWGFILTGKSDTITVMQNHIYKTSGRGPHVGGTSGYTQYIHLVNNYFDNIDGHAVEADVGSVLLTEGNYFDAVTTPDLTDGASTGNEFFIQSSGDAATCQAALGRACQANALGGSGAVASRLSSSVLSNLKAQSSVKGFNPITASAAATYVQNNAGVGKIN